MSRAALPTLLCAESAEEGRRKAAAFAMHARACVRCNRPPAFLPLFRAALDEAAREGSIYREFSAFLKWRKTQPAIMNANWMSALSGGARQIIFDRVSAEQTLRCCFDFDTVTASFEDI